MCLQKDGLKKKNKKKIFLNGNKKQTWQNQKCRPQQT